MDEYYRAITPLPHGWPGHWDSCQHKRQCASRNCGCGQAVCGFLPSGRQCSLLQEFCRLSPALQLMRLDDQLQIEGDLSHPVRRRGTHAHQTELAQGYLTTAAGNRVGVAGQFVDRDGQSGALQKVTSLNLRIARAVPVQPAGRTSGATEKAFYWDAFGRRAGSGKTTLLRTIARDAGRADAAASLSWWTSAARSFRRVEKMPPLDLHCPAWIKPGPSRWHCARFRRKLFAGRAGQSGGNDGTGTGLLQRGGLCCKCPCAGRCTGAVPPTGADRCCNAGCCGSWSSCRAGDAGLHPGGLCRMSGLLRGAVCFAPVVRLAGRGCGTGQNRTCILPPLQRTIELLQRIRQEIQYRRADLQSSTGSFAARACWRKLSTVHCSSCLHRKDFGDRTRLFHRVLLRWSWSCRSRTGMRTA